ncbi:hypothetical protein PsorP6_010029 [Peronosclerospora sorghi]|uniref:Uncharacterized protein n=1 Tax=Peronosclerospora sorghi TaxID=230839 RepID=A0ACC0VXC9_9STRA|nr:hypothetical protein PsorP6_010029 [Peronosclerospora sorghi]
MSSLSLGQAATKAEIDCQRSRVKGINNNLLTFSLDSRFLTFEWRNAIAENPRSDAALDVIMQKTLTATSLRLGYVAPSTSHYCIVVFLPFESILKRKSYLSYPGES